MNNKQAFSLLSRYLLLILLALGNFFLIYSIASPATIKASFFIINGFYPAAQVLDYNTIMFAGLTAKIIPACVAGAAYYLLLVLNLSTPMNLKKRFKSLAFIIVSFYLLNLIRIITFAKLLTFGTNYFDNFHAITWYFGSTVLLILIWFVNAWIFKIKTIPIYSDLHSILKDTKNKKPGRKK
jgi:exosortase/archaeosortase family protein